MVPRIVMVIAAALFLAATAGLAKTATPTAAAAGTAEEGAETPPSLGIKPVEVAVEKVLSPNIVVVKELGEVSLIGLQPVPTDAKYYGAALKMVKDKVDGETVRVEVCPNIPQNEQGQTRALVFYRVGTEWSNLSVILIRAGLARVSEVPGCHVPIKAWLAYENEARGNRLGMWKDWVAPKAMTSDTPSESDFQ
jgi:endonuclease YncB( thermonuclease family)